MFFAVFLVFSWRRLWEWAWGYEPVSADIAELGVIVLYFVRVS